MPIAAPGTWGGLFLARPPPSMYDDISLITAGGFTVLGSYAVAGESTIYVYGTELSVMLWTNDYAHKYDIRGWFFRYPAGEEITESRVRKWVERKQFAY
jgi:hypothetical protein